MANITNEEAIRYVNEQIRPLAERMRSFIALAAFVVTFPLAAFGQGVSLKWNANTEADLSHYNVYRSDTFEGPYERLNPTTETVPLRWTANPEATTATVIASREVVYTETREGRVWSPSYIDLDVEPGLVYWYCVTAVDSAWNESQKSGRAGAFVVDTVAPAAPKGMR